MPKQNVRGHQRKLANGRTTQGRAHDRSGRERAARREGNIGLSVIGGGAALIVAKLSGALSAVGSGLSWASGHSGRLMVAAGVCVALTALVVGFMTRGGESRAEATPRPAPQVQIAAEPTPSGDGIAQVRPRYPLLDMEFDSGRTMTQCRKKELPYTAMQPVGPFAAGERVCIRVRDRALVTRDRFRRAPVLRVKGKKM